ncbi:MAG TPA: hypothetical protein VES02_10200, partial [Dermatophilaceae bacterium]|nr:hypothetical protein [Dermatophilaceae bacterium]
DPRLLAGRTSSLKSKRSFDPLAAWTYDDDVEGVAEVEGVSEVEGVDGAADGGPLLVEFI